MSKSAPIGKSIANSHILRLIKESLFLVLIVNFYKKIDLFLLEEGQFMISHPRVGLNTNFFFSKTFQSSIWSLKLF